MKRKCRDKHSSRIKEIGEEIVGVEDMIEEKDKLVKKMVDIKMFSNKNIQKI